MSKPEHRDADATSTDLPDLFHPDSLADIDVIAGDPPVPINVWPVAPEEHRHHHHSDVAADVAGAVEDVALLPPRLAARIVHTYSRRRDLVVSFDRDANLRAAVLTAGCRYRRLRGLGSLRDLAPVAGRVRLAVLRWPRPAKTARPTETAEQLSRACRALLAPRGYAVAVLAPPAGPGDLAGAADLIPAASRAGLGYLQHIVAVTAPLDDDPPPTDQLHARVHVDLLVLVLSAGRHG